MIKAPGDRPPAVAGEYGRAETAAAIREGSEAGDDGPGV